MSIAVCVGKNIKLFRINAGLKQKDLAEKLGKKVQYISAIENGRKEPSLSLLHEIAMNLHVPITMLLSDRSEFKDDNIGKLQKLLFELVASIHNEKSKEQ